MSRSNPPPNSFFASTKALSMRSSVISGRSSPSSSLHSAPGGVATFISNRGHRPPPFQRRHPTDPGSSDEPEESGGIGIGGVGVGVSVPQQYRRYESDEEDEDDDDNEIVSSLPPATNGDESVYDDSRSATSRASTPRQRPFPQKGQGQGQQPMRIPDFQQIFSRDDVFEDDKTPSFDESTMVQPPQAGRMMEHMRVPVPTGGPGPGDSSAPWGKRERSEDVVEIKPEAFMAQQKQQQQQQWQQQQQQQHQHQQGRSGFEKVNNTEMRLEVAAYDDEGEENGTRAPASEADECRQEVKDPVSQGHEDDEDEEYFTNEYSDEDGSDFEERGPERKTGPGLWSEGSPTLSSRTWSRSGTRSKGSPGNVPLQKKRSEEPRFNGGGRERGGRAYGQEKLNFRPPKSTVLPLAVRRPVSDPVLDLQLSPRARAELAIQAATNNSIAVIPERTKPKDSPQRRMISTSTNDIDLQKLLPDTELSKFRTLPDLLTHLTALRAASHTTISTTQLPLEIDELARSYYPHDPRKPERFFNRLDDAQHAAAGEYILGKKREMEEQLAGVVAKRRRLVEGMRGEVADVAEVRVVKLRRTEERREMLRGGVGRMLREAGLWL